MEEKKMMAQKQAEEATIVATFNEAEQDGDGDGNGNGNDHGKEEGERAAAEEPQPFLSVKSLLWHGGSVWDAWFSCASNQVRVV